MKKTKILYWVFTILFAGFMLFSAVPDAMSSKEAIDFITKLGYPAYIVPFLGIAKILGALVILIPGMPRLKEWAYFGLWIDLIGATYSIMKTEPNAGGMVFMLVLTTIGILSYVFYHKKLKETV